MFKSVIYLLFSYTLSDSWITYKNIIFTTGLDSKRLKDVILELLFNVSELYISNNHDKNTFTKNTPDGRFSGGGIEMVLCECGLMVWLPQGKNEVLHKKNFGLATDRQRPLQTVVNCEVSEVLLWHTWRPAISKHAKPS